MSWQEHAACIGTYDQLDWFPSSSRPGGMDRAYQRNLAACRAVCASCPVQAQCLQSAIEHGEKGVWAGLTARQRQRLHETAKPPKERVNTAKCGTESGYARHLRWSKTEPCDDCRAAHALQERQRTYRQRNTG